MTRFLDPARLVGIGGRRNLITNPSFEVDTTGWMTGPAGMTIARSTAWAVAGVASLLVTRTTNVATYTTAWTPTASIPVTSGATYTASATVRMAPGGASSGPFVIRVQWYDSTNAFISASDGATLTVTNTANTRLSATATAPAGAVTAQIGVMQTTAAVNDAFYVDAVLMEAGGLALPYFDGSSLGCVWTGAAHNSASLNALDLGGSKVTGVAGIDVAGNPVQNVPTPAAAGDPATKAYIDGKAAPTQQQVFTSSGTWTKPTGAVAVQVQLIGGGGGGGAGACGAAGTSRSGGGGAGGANSAENVFAASVLPASIGVTVGAGGGGAPGSTGNGTAGGNGGNSYLGGSTNAWLWAGGGGGGGGGGVGVDGTGGASGNGFSSAAGGGATGTNSNGYSPGSSYGWCAGGGGGGGGITTANVTGDGGDGSINQATDFGVANAAGGAATGGAGGAGPDVTASWALCGAGGAGGGANKAGNGGRGGNGARYGGAGGGGGATVTGFTSGGGGTGAAGVVVITTYF